MAKLKTGLKDSIDLKDTVVEGMVEKKAQAITVIDLRKHINPLADFLVICTGTSDRHVDAITESVEKEVWKKKKEDPWVSEGKDRNTWVILDYVNVVVHIFVEQKREFYSLEDLWGDSAITRIESPGDMEEELG